MRKISYALLVGMTSYISAQQPIEMVTIAILAKSMSHTLPLCLKSIEKQTYQAKKIYLYIRTNNNNDDTEAILREWINEVQDRYAGIYFDATDVETPVQNYKQHEWNYERFKVLGKIRQDSVQWAYEHNSHYFVIDCDNFILPHTLETLIRTNLPIVAPLLHTASNLYSNFHAAVDKNGYYEGSPDYNRLWAGEIKGLIDVPVVHCTYFIRHDILDKVCYDDESARFEYVIFSDSARKKNIPQYLDTREVYGFLTGAETEADFITEAWIPEFYRKLVVSGDLSSTR